MSFNRARLYTGVCLSTLLFVDWLEDIGLPQYKDSFRDNIVDGRMLNYLTVVGIMTIMTIINDI